MGIGATPVDARLLERIRNVESDIQKSGVKGWYSMPECPQCSKPRHCYFHTALGFKCHKCGAHGSIGHFIEVLQGAGYHIPMDGVSLPSIDHFFEGLEPEEKTPDICTVDLPSESIPFTVDELPAYFIDRGFSGELLLNLDLHYCTVGQYAMRIIVPLETREERAFLAYISSRDQDGKKVLYPTGCSIGHFLFPYNYVRMWDPKLVVIVEGTTDAMRVLTHRAEDERAGVPLALLGKNLTDRQMLALSHIQQLDTEFVVALDSDTEGSSYRDFGAETAVKLARWFGRDRVSIVRLSTYARSKGCANLDVDPDDIKDIVDWLQLLESRTPMTEALF